MYKDRSYTTGHWHPESVDSGYGAAERQSLAGALVTVIAVVTVIVIAAVLYSSVIIH